MSKGVEVGRCRGLEEMAPGRRKTHGKWGQGRGAEGETQRLGPMQSWHNHKRILMISVISLLKLFGNLQLILFYH